MYTIPSKVHLSQTGKLGHYQMRLQRCSRDSVRYDSKLNLYIFRISLCSDAKIVLHTDNVIVNDDIANR